MSIRYLYLIIIGLMAFACVPNPAVEQSKFQDDLDFAVSYPEIEVRTQAMPTPDTFVNDMMIDMIIDPPDTMIVDPHLQTRSIQWIGSPNTTSTPTIQGSFEWTHHVQP